MLVVHYLQYAKLASDDLHFKYYSIFAVLGLLIVRNLISDKSRAKNNEIVIGLGHRASVVFAIIVGFVAISVLGVSTKQF